MCVHEAFKFAVDNPGSRIWWVAPNYSDANELGYDALIEVIPRKLMAR